MTTDSEVFFAADLPNSSEETRPQPTPLIRLERNTYPNIPHECIFANMCFSSTAKNEIPNVKHVAYIIYMDFKQQTVQRDLGTKSRRKIRPRIAASGNDVGIAEISGLSWTLLKLGTM